MPRIGITALAAMTAIVAAAVLSTLVRPAPASSAATCPGPPKLPSQFVAQIDNPYLPLIPGTTLEYRGKLDGESARDVFSVTHDTKVILGDDGHP